MKSIVFILILAFNSLSLFCQSYAHVNSLVDTIIKREDLLAATHLEVFSDSTDIEIIEFTVLVPVCFFVRETSFSNQFTDNQKFIFSEIQCGSKVYFDEIKAQYKYGETIILPSFYLKVE